MYVKIQSFVLYVGLHAYFHATCFLNVKALSVQNFNCKLNSCRYYTQVASLKAAFAHKELSMPTLYYEVTASLVIAKNLMGIAVGFEYSE